VFLAQALPYIQPDMFVFFHSSRTVIYDPLILFYRTAACLFSLCLVHRQLVIYVLGWCFTFVLPELHPTFVRGAFCSAKITLPCHPALQVFVDTLKLEYSANE